MSGADIKLSSTSHDMHTNFRIIAPFTTNAVTLRDTDNLNTRVIVPYTDDITRKTVLIRLGMYLPRQTTVMHWCGARLERHSYSRNTWLGV